MKKKKLLSLLLALCLVLALTACGGSGDAANADTSSAAPSEDGGAAASNDGDTVTLGMIGPLTGSLAVYGTHIEKGVKLTIDEINAAGGVSLSGGTSQLAVETKDDLGVSTECVNAMNALISDGIQIHLLFIEVIP